MSIRMWVGPSVVGVCTLSREKFKQKRSELGFWHSKDLQEIELCRTVLKQVLNIPKKEPGLFEFIAKPIKSAIT